MSVIEYADRSDWLAKRQQGIGSSDAAAALGLSRYKTPARLFYEKTGQIEPEDISAKEAVYLGLKFEPVVADMYADETGRTLATVDEIQVHPEHSFLIASPDRRVVDEPRLVECKTAGLVSQFASILDEFGSPGSDEIPREYIVQAMHQMLVTGAEVVDVPVLFGRKPFAIYTVKRDDIFIAKMIVRLTQFWYCVQTGTPPASKTAEDVSYKFPVAAPKPIEATTNLVAAVDQYRALKESMKESDARLDELKMLLGEYMGECDLLTFEGRELLTYRNKSVSRVDLTRLKAERPDVYTAFLNTTTGREFRLKAEK